MRVTLLNDAVRRIGHMMAEDKRLPYRVQGRWMSGSRASLCATPRQALQRLTAYRKARYRDVEAIGPEGVLTEPNLHRLIIENAERLRAAAAIEAAERDPQPAS